MQQSLQVFDEADSPNFKEFMFAKQRMQDLPLEEKNKMAFLSVMDMDATTIKVPQLKDYHSNVDKMMHHYQKKHNLRYGDNFSNAIVRKSNQSQVSDSLLLRSRLSLSDLPTKSIKDPTLSMNEVLTKS